MFRLLLILTLGLMSQVVWTTNAMAQSLVDKHRYRGNDDDGSRRHERGGISLDEAVQMAQRRYNARAVKAEITSDGDHRVYVIRLLNDSGRVWTVRVDAETGSMR